MFDNIFNKSALNELYLKKIDKISFNNREKEIISNWNKKIDDGILEKERSNYGKFENTILNQLLGFEEKDFQNDFEITGDFIDYIILKDENPYIIVELKGSKKDLDKRINGESPVEQGFRYASKISTIEWVIISNYNEFRLYNKKTQEKYISFTIKEIKEDLKNGDLLKKFLFIFSKIAIIENEFPLKLLNNTILIEQNLESEFYKLFNETRLMLVKELKYSNNFSNDKAIYFSQTILNRYLFICFAEDLGLLPSETSTKTLMVPIENTNLHKNTMWERLNELFTFVNEGQPYKNIESYNGGLFKKDLKEEGLNKIRDIVEDKNLFKDTLQKWKFKEYEEEVNKKIGSTYKDILNPIYKNLLLISTFDFSSDLDVNILGHIFENSIGDLEELKNEKNTSKRKKDGIFYTPDFITDYICKNTIIPYLSKNKNKNNEENKNNKNNNKEIHNNKNNNKEIHNNKNNKAIEKNHNTTVSELILEYKNNLNELEEKLKNIKIIDIACGSGAFLNKAADILLNIHQAIHDTKYENKDTLDYIFDSFESKKQILLNNIYGVDLNEESVEITKLSLFLKIAKKGMKLPNLDKNIKTGNSIIDDINYAGIKHFNFKKHFPEIFNDENNKNKGFDIVIGNPPYVRQEKIKQYKPYLEKNYQTYTGVADLYVYFFEKGINILKYNGYLGFICSNKYTRANYGKKLRHFMLNQKITNYNDYTGENIFQDASVDPSVIIINKTKTKDKILINNDFFINQNILNDDSWSFDSPEILNLRDKIKNKGTLIKDIREIYINRGITTGFNEAFIIDKKTMEDLIDKDPKNMEIIMPVLKGKDIKKWNINYQEIYLILTKNGIEIPTKYPVIYDYLTKFEEKLTKRYDQGNYWYNLRNCAYYDDFEKFKIIFSEMSHETSFCLDLNQFFLIDTAYILTSDAFDLNYLIALLNSKLVNWQFEKISSKLGTGAIRFKKTYIEQLPIIISSEYKQKPFIVLADKIINLNKEQSNEVKSLQNWLIRNFDIKINTKLQKYYELDVNSFIKEIKKQNKNIKRKEEDEIENEFNKSLAILSPLQSEIKEVDYEINSLVYKLYNLTEEEIAIIEKNIK